MLVEREGGKGHAKSKSYPKVGFLKKDKKNQLIAML